ncbi:MAG: heme oxygenase [Caryophanon sp.]|nr:heme oxygenase [Caryophanon sp.]
MIVVTNRIEVKKGFGKQMAPAFTRPSGLDQFKGFVKVEVLVSENENSDEMNVNMFWETMEDFQVWRNSDAFKAAHKRDGGEKQEGGHPHGEGDSPIIGSKLIIAEVAASLQY